MPAGKSNSFRASLSNIFYQAYKRRTTIDPVPAVFILVIMSVPFSSPFGANANPFGNDRSQNVMHSLAEEDENENGRNQATGIGPGAGISFAGTFGGDASTDTPPTVRGPPHPDSYPAQYNFARRTSVSAESLKPSADSYDNWSPPFHEKTADQLGRLKRAIEGNFLFSHLDEEQTAQILGALVEKPIPAKGIKVSHNARGNEWE